MSASSERGEAARPVIICYDGSKAAMDAIEFAADLLPGASVVVLTVWRPILDALLAVSLGPAPPIPISDPADADERQREGALLVARDGARRAKKVGLDAEPLAVKGSGAIWETIDEVAHESDARLIVCGASRTGVKSALLDTVPTALIHRASRPVTVVPSADAASERRREASEKRAASEKRGVSSHAARA